MLRFVKRAVKSPIFWRLALVFSAFGGIFFFVKSRAVADFYKRTFAIKSIKFSGMDTLSKDELLKISGLKIGNCIFDKDIDNIRESIENLSWVKSATVKRILPSNYEISIVERVPIAYWQNKDQLFLVDETGTVLPTTAVKSFPSLPISVGENAPSAIPGFLESLKTFPLISQQLVFCTYLGNRRWDIQISRGLLIKLPEMGLEDALKTLQRMGNKDGYFSDDVSVIDLRIQNRVIISKKKVKKKAEVASNEM